MTTQQPRPLLVYDGDCGFCSYAVDYARAVTFERIDYEPYQSAGARYPAVSDADFARQIYLFNPDGSFTTAGRAALTCLALEPRLRGWLFCYRFIPGFAWLTELAYQWTARHRGFALRLSRLFFGNQLRPLDYQRTTSIIVRATGVLAACALMSWWVQAEGLIGDDGILPVASYFAALGDAGYGFFDLPSLYWLAPAFAATHWLIALGLLGSLVLALNRFVAPAAACVYVAYLSLFAGGQIFMGYQWDILLVEVAAALIVLGLRPRLGIWVLRLLLFRFMLMSGVVKLASGDAAWHDLSALDYHFETQPLPTPLAYFAHHLPDVILRAGVAFTFFVELVLPFLLFAPRRPRILAAIIMITFELMIIATGNYNFFNALTIVLCVAAFDDRFLSRDAIPASEPGRIRVWSGAVLVVFLLLGAMQVRTAFDRSPGSDIEQAVRQATSPWLLVNGYGLFAVMTTHRDELAIEGSLDGVEWREYKFRYKPQSPTRAPPWVAPHQPRLDWQMWFAVLAPPEASPWLDELLLALLQARAPVLDLLEADPFAGSRPTWVRVLSYRYRFAAPGTQAWWQREAPQVWYPAIRLREPIITHDALELRSARLHQSEHRFLDLARQLYRHEARSWKQIILPGFVYDADAPEPFGFRVRNRFIQLTQFQ